MNTVFRVVIITSCSIALLRNTRGVSNRAKSPTRFTNLEIYRFLQILKISKDLKIFQGLKRFSRDFPILFNIAGEVAVMKCLYITYWYIL